MSNSLFTHLLTLTVVLFVSMVTHAQINADLVPLNEKSTQPEIQRWIATAAQKYGKVKTKDAQVEIQDMTFTGCRMTYQMMIRTFINAPRKPRLPGPSPPGYSVREPLDLGNTRRYWLSFDLGRIDLASISLEESDYDKEKNHSLHLSTIDMASAITHAPKKESLTKNKPTLNKVKFEIEKELGNDFRAGFIQATKLCQNSAIAK